MAQTATRSAAGTNHPAGDVQENRILIPSWPGALAACAAAAVFYTFLGLPLARKAAFPGVPPLSIAPALGWAVHTVVALPVLSLTGFSTAAVTLYSAAFAACSGFALRRIPPPPAAALPLWAWPLAACLAVLPLSAIMPKYAAGGILLAPPMFDHVKIALVDAILRDGLPVPNPFYGPESPGHLAYYYLWHFGTAAFARLVHEGGWQAEAALTGFTAMSSILLVMGLATALGGRSRAVCASALLCLPGSLRPVLAAAAGRGAANALIPPGSDLGNWLNQAAWVPQHMASATCALLSVLLMLRLAEGGRVLAALLGLTVAAGFESSIWVGGIGFAAAGSLLGLRLLWSCRGRRLRLAARGLAAACLAALLIAPFVRAELQGLAARHGGGGIIVAPYPVFGALVPAGWRAALDIPAFWLLLLPFAFPALIPLGAASLLRPRRWELNPASRHLAGSLAAAAIAWLAVAWLLRSTLDNNDLGWRCVLPALLILAPVAACRLERCSAAVPLAACAVLILLGLPQTVVFAGDYTRGQLPGDPAGLAGSIPLWQEVRRIAGPDERVANNPLAVQSATPWPVDIGWALLSDRPSCYAGWETVLAYGGVSRPVLEELSARFARVFAGTPADHDLQSLAMGENCSVVVVTPADGAWARDPFAASALFRLASQSSGWRIYRRVPVSQTNPAAAAAASAPEAAPSGPAPRPGPPSPPVR